jgi:hypothetical protein
VTPKASLVQSNDDTRDAELVTTRETLAAIAARGYGRRRDLDGDLDELLAG